MVVEEKTLRFEFGPTWERVVKYDQCTGYQKGICRLSGQLNGVAVGTKGVDVVGVRNGEIYLIEINDFRGHVIETKASRAGEVWLEIGLKVRDTLAGLLAAYTKSDDEIGRPIVPGLLNPGKLHVISWMEQDLPSREWKAWSSIQRNLLRQRLRWLNARFDVMNQCVGALPDVTVHNRPLVRSSR